MHYRSLVKADSTLRVANFTIGPLFLLLALTITMVKEKPLKVLFLSSDTGGGHRASAEALAKQFTLLFPGSTFDLLDVWKDDGVWPFRTIVQSYKHLSANPAQWRILYHVTNTSSVESLADWHTSIHCQDRILKRISKYDPDCVVSVHPTMNHTPLRSVQQLSDTLGKHIPFFTVVTDLGAAHGSWFQKDVEKIYVASNALKDIALERAQTPPDKIVMSGLPIRHEFALQAQQLGDRTSDSGKHYQSSIRKQLDINSDKKMVLLMGGGEGVGSLSTITNQVYVGLTRHGIDATICIICGRNGKLQKELERRDWDAVLMDALASSAGNHMKQFVEKDPSQAPRRVGNVSIKPLGFVSRMAEYMVAADILLSKAGPGTIAEAASLGLPVLLTSFLPGQEAGNVEFVEMHGFGKYESNPGEIGEAVAALFLDPLELEKRSAKAQQVGRPNAAAAIVQDIGSVAQKWLSVNEAMYEYTKLNRKAKCPINGL